MPGDIYTLLKNQHVFGTIIVARIFYYGAVYNFFLPALFRNLAVYPSWFPSNINVYIARGSTMSCIVLSSEDKLIGSVVCVLVSVE